MSKYVTVYNSSGKPMIVGADSAAARGENKNWGPKGTIKSAKQIRNETAGKDWVDTGKDNYGQVLMNKPLKDGGNVSTFSSINAQYVDKYLKKGYILDPRSQSIDRALSSDRFKAEAAANAAIKNGTYNPDTDYYREVGSSLGGGGSSDDDYYSDRGGGGSSSGGQQGGQSSGYNSQAQLQQLQALAKEMSESYYASQKAQIDKMLAQQLVDLEKAYNDAIEAGEVSVRDAEKQFESQKAELEEAAYQQAESTRAYGNEMGIQYSQQMVGLQQGDNARVNKLSNANASDRDNRINDIRDRINSITKAKDLDIAMANAGHSYNLMGAAGQASQMYADKLYGTMQEDYTANRNQGFTQDNMGLQNQFDIGKMDLQNQFDIGKMGLQNQFDLGKMGYQHELNLDQMMVQQGYSKEMQSLVHNNDLAKMAVSFGYDISKMDKQQINQLELMSQENTNILGRMDKQQLFDLDKMDVQQGYNIDTINLQFGNQLRAMDKQAGISASLAAAGRQHDVDMWEKQNEEKRNWLTDSLKIEMNQNTLNRNWELEQLRKEITPGTREYEIKEAQINQQYQADTKKAYSDAATAYSLDSIFNNPLLHEDIGERPKSYKEIYGGMFSGMNQFGGVNDTLFGTTSNQSDWDNLNAQKTEAEKRLEAILRKSGVSDY